MQFTITFDVYVIGFVIMILSIILLIVHWIFRDNFYLKLEEYFKQMEKNKLFLYMDKFRQRSKLFIGLWLFGLLLMIISKV